jgi:hypothetical protein
MIICLSHVTCKRFGTAVLFYLVLTLQVPAASAASAIDSARGL